MVTSCKIIVYCHSQIIGIEVVSIQNNFCYYKDSLCCFLIATLSCLPPILPPSPMAAISILL